MIWNFFLAWASGLITLITLLFPSSDPSIIANVNTTASSFKSMLSTINYVFPIDTLFLVISIILSTELSILGIKLSVYILQHLSLGFVKKI